MSVVRENPEDDQDDIPEIDLDFHVEFPTPGLGQEDETIWPVNDVMREDDKAILVVLLGWAGAQDKYLAKYSEFYLKRGCIVLRYITPIKAIFFETGKLPIFANRILRLLKDLQLSSHPTFFHVFSNGGAFLYSNILREVSIADSSKELNLVGTIFDSAPAPRNLFSLFKALANIFLHYNWLRWFISAFVVFLLVLQIFWFHLKTAFRFCLQGDKIEPTSLARRHEQLDAPPLHNWLTRISRVQNHRFLFLYSDDDMIIPACKVEKVARVLQAKGNQVTLNKFQGSGHVQHYRENPTEYVDVIKNFIRRSMEEKETDSESNPIILWDERE